MPKPSEIFDTPAATGFSRVRGNEEIIEEFKHTVWHSRLKAFDLQCNDEEDLDHPTQMFIGWLRKFLTTKDQEKEEAVLKKEQEMLRFFAGLSPNERHDVATNQLKSLPTEDNK